VCGTVRDGVVTVGKDCWGEVWFLFYLACPYPPNIPLTIPDHFLLRFRFSFRDNKEVFIVF
jgi:hypothetical protein